MSDHFLAEQEHRREIDVLIAAVLEGCGIVTKFDYPPIPDRSNDWCAYYDGREEDGPFGRGKSEAAAVQDLLTNYPDDCPREIISALRRKAEA